jgi:hypothetical protein
MSNTNFDDETPQFRTVEYCRGDPSHCGFCYEPVLTAYYRINGRMACSGCADDAYRELAKDSYAAYGRALIYGVSAALMGTILYATVIKTRIVLGYVASLAVGWMVGKAILSGSNGVGGRRYQITAALLTYAAVSMATVPMRIYDDAQQWRTSARSDGEQDRQMRPAATAPASGLENPGTISDKTLPQLALVGLVSPFLQAWESLRVLDLIILLAGMSLAVGITKGKPLMIYGPFQNALKTAG